MTLVVQIGNSDDKLTQAEWSNFVVSLREAFVDDSVHFCGCSDGSAPWQNACLIAEVDDKTVKERLAAVSELRAAFKQDSAAVTLGVTEFV